MTPKFNTGDKVKYGSGESVYEVAVPHGPHGTVGIYDEPPGQHIDYVNADSLTLAEAAPREMTDEEIGQRLLAMGMTAMPNAWIIHTLRQSTPLEPPAPKPQVECCMFQTSDHDDLMEDLEKCLNDGWEVVSVTESNDCEFTSWYTVIYKRNIP